MVFDHVELSEIGALAVEREDRIANLERLRRREREVQAELDAERAAIAHLDRSIASERRRLERLIAERDGIAFAAVERLR